MSTMTSDGSHQSGIVSRGIALATCLLAAALILPATAAAQGETMGETYLALDAQVTRVTVQLEDAYIVTDRSPDGDLQSTLFDPAGKALAKLHFAVDELELYGGDGKRLDAPSYVEAAEVSSAWAGRQLYSLWSDLRALGSGKAASIGEWTWRAGFLRFHDPAVVLETSAKAHRRALEAKVVAVNTRFGDLEAVSVRDEMAELPRVGPKGELAGPAFTTRLLDLTSGRPMGRAIWYPKAKVFTWHIPGLSSGLVDEERMEKSFSFDPDMSWSNLQLFGLQQMHLDMDLRDAQTLTKDTPGCTGLHWLDNTIFRPCCDRHDLCYAKENPVCNIWSWLIIGSSWSCIQCNIAAVLCFATGGATPYIPAYDPTAPPGSGCEGVGGVCPAWCSGPQCMAGW